ncbi:MAG TPA: YceI family protein [Candidatus Polarisedimenticolia bacterium]|nr:YceI family protein [Candidatus Polarisedimenticolia bacterium]
MRTAALLRPAVRRAAIAAAVARGAGLLSAAAPADLAIDPAGSRVAFVLRTTWHEVHGTAPDVRGTVTSQSGDLTADGRVLLEVVTATMETGNQRRDRAMRRDHLHVDRFPIIRFSSAAPPSPGRIERDAAGSLRRAELSLEGDLEIHGVVRRIRLPVTLEAEGNGWMASGSATVRLSEHGIPDPSILLNKVRDEVQVSFRLRLTSPAAQR